MEKEPKHVPFSEEVKKAEGMMANEKKEMEINKKKIWTEDVWKKSLEEVQQLKASLKGEMNDAMKDYFEEAKHLIHANSQQFTPAERAALLLRPGTYDQYQKKVKKLDDLLYQEEIQGDIKRGHGDKTVKVEMEMFDLYTIEKAFREKVELIAQQYMKDVVKLFKNKQIPAQEIQNLQNKVSDIQEKLEICDEVELNKI